MLRLEHRIGIVHHFDFQISFADSYLSLFFAKISDKVLILYSLFVKPKDIIHTFSINYLTGRQLWSSHSNRGISHYNTRILIISLRCRSFLDLFFLLLDRDFVSLFNDLQKGLIFVLLKKFPKFFRISWYVTFRQPAEKDWLNMPSITFSLQEFLFSKHQFFDRIVLWGETSVFQELSNFKVDSCEISKGILSLRIFEVQEWVLKFVLDN